MARGSSCYKGLTNHAVGWPPVTQQQDDYVHSAPVATDGSGPAREAVWRYAVGLVAVVVGGLALNVVLAALYHLAHLRDVAQVLGSPDTDAFPLSARIAAFTFLMGSLIAFLPVMRIVLPAWHRRPWRTFLTAAGRWRWRRLVVSCAVMLALLSAMLVLQLAVAPGAMRFQGKWNEIAVFAVLAGVLVPLQVAAEEIFFRGYVMQAISRMTAIGVIRIAGPAILFTLAHWQNPETQQGAGWVIASYASAGLYLGLLALMDKGLESAIGAHLAINIFAILVVGSDVSVSPSSVIWRETVTDYRMSLVAGLVIFACHFLLMFRGRHNAWRRAPAQ